MLSHHIHLLLVLFAFAVYTQQQLMDPAFLEKWGNIVKACGTQEGYDPVAAQKLWDADSFPNDNKLKCFHKCVNMKLGVIDQNGDVVDEALGEISAQFNNVSTKAEIVAECGPLKGADLCETAYKLMACIKKATLD